MQQRAVSLCPQNFQTFPRPCVTHHKSHRRRLPLLRFNQPEMWLLSDVQIFADILTLKVVKSATSCPIFSMSLKKMKTILLHASHCTYISAVKKCRQKGWFGLDS